MTPNEFEDMLRRISELPHGIFPHTETFYGLSTVTKKDWDAIKWNDLKTGPDGWDHLGYDDTAPEKPTFSAVEAEYDRMEYSVDKLITNLRNECEQRIIKSNIARDNIDDIRKQIHNELTSEQKTEMSRLRTKYKTLKTSIQSMTLPQRKNFDPTLDTHWAA